MVLANTGARIGSAEGWNARISAVRTTGLATIADGIMERWFVRAFRVEHPHEIARMRDVLVKASPDGYAACCAAIRDYDARPELAAIRAPTLAIAGAHDGPTPPSDLRFIAEHVPGARYVELDAAHLSNVEQPSDFVAALVGHFTA
jgi:3-oxoadipate enol-lactonase